MSTLLINFALRGEDSINVTPIASIIVRELIVKDIDDVMKEITDQLSESLEEVYEELLK